MALYRAIFQPWVFHLNVTCQNLAQIWARIRVELFSSDINAHRMKTGT